ncbi:MAG: hypothetical protein OXI60_08835 [Acidiferrobacterales bacterium]|nr:hypothetical protein [Acidiferrobacterales bacterium]
MIGENLKFLVVEGYGKASRDELVAGGMSPASDLYRQMLLSLAPNSTVDIVTPADADARLPSGVELKSYDGVAMTGSNLSVTDSDNPAVLSQISLQQEVFRQRGCRVSEVAGHCRSGQLPQAERLMSTPKVVKWDLGARFV